MAQYIASVVLFMKILLTSSCNSGFSIPRNTQNRTVARSIALTCFKFMAGSVIIINGSGCKRGQ